MSAAVDILNPYRPKRIVIMPHAVSDGSLIRGQQQYSGDAAARLVIEALGTRGGRQVVTGSAPDCSSSHE